MYEDRLYRFGRSFGLSPTKELGRVGRDTVGGKRSRALDPGALALGPFHLTGQDSSQNHRAADHCDAARRL